MKQPKINLDNFLLTLNRKGKSMIRCHTCYEHIMFESLESYDATIDTFVRPFCDEHRLKHGIFISEKNIQKSLTL